MQARAKSWLVWPAALAVIITAGCGRGEYADRNQAAGTPPAAQSAQARNDNPDWWTTTKVQAKYFVDDAVKGRNIDVTTHEGVVTLQGTVDSPAAKERAVALAKDVDGVVSVQDHLQVRSASAGRPADGAVATSGKAETGVNPGWITTKIQAQYYAEPGLKPWNIDVTTGADGSVTLTGEIDNAADKAKAVSIATNTDGVTEVNDRLRVKGETGTGAPTDRAVPSGMQPDAWITAKIQSKYFLDAEVKGTDIDVTTENGRVTLAGTVANASQRRQAVAIARNTDGVVDVRDDLKVGGGDASTGVNPLPKVAGTDEWITTKIESKFFLDRNLKATDIDVETSDGVVTLAGHVPDAAARQAAESIARDTAGVRRVVNNLQTGT